MKGFLFEYFRYTKSERNGFIVLMSICIALLSYYHFQDLLFPQEARDMAHYEELLKKVYKEPLKPSTFVEKSIVLQNFDPNNASEQLLLANGFSQKQAKTLLNFRNKGGKFKKAEDLLKVYGINQKDFDRLKDYIKFTNPKKKKQSEEPAPSKASYPLFDFDPNTASEEVLKQLGLTNKTIKTILNFRKAVPFYEARDFSKVYGLTEEDYNRLKPYIKIVPKDIIKEKQSVETKANKKEWKKEWKQEHIDINLAIAEEWETLRGIGPVFSKRIVKFREKLGGFHSKKQVKETFGMTDSLYLALEPYLDISKTEKKKININNVNIDELKSHPYFSWKQAKVIVNYRENHGVYKDGMDLLKTRVVKEEDLEKMGPYLEF